MQVKPGQKTHGMCGTKFYGIWNGICGRCRSKNQYRSDRYIGRGIKNEWSSFEEFKNDMYAGYLDHIKKYGGRQTQIDRKNNDGNYSKENCRWVTRKQQQRNTSWNRWIAFQGKTKTVSMWAEELHLRYNTICCRLSRGWSEKDALTKPIQFKNYYGKTN